MATVPGVCTTASAVNLGDSIHTLAASAGSDDPIVALTAIAELHSELDRVEAVTVRRARNGGAPWQLIALALGVSRQAVHKKYGRG